MPNWAVVYAFSDSTREAYTAVVTQAGVLIFAAENGSLPVPKDSEACRARKGVSKVIAVLCGYLKAILAKSTKH